MLIIDMPMPVKEWNCLDCKALCVDMLRHYCGITKKTIDTLKNMRARPDWCPIKGVLPDEHGDLIDRDIMYKEIELWKSTATDTITMCFLYHVERLLMSIRPIIAAERKDDEQTRSNTPS